jgi:iron(III) transport system permease protein
MIPERSWSLRAFNATIIALFCVIAMAPLAAVLAQSFWVDGAPSLAAYKNALLDARQRTLLLNTLAIAFGATLLATPLGAFVGFALAYFRVRSRHWLKWLLAVPVLIPPYVHAIVLVDLLGSRGLLRYGLDAAQQSGSLAAAIYTRLGVVIVLAVAYFPVVALATVAYLRRYPWALEEPARLVARPLRIFLRIAIPLAMPHILCAAAFVFILSLVEFGVPSLLQVNVYSVEIYSRFSTTYNVPEAVALALPVLLPGVCALMLALYLRPRPTTSAQYKGQRPDVAPAASIALAAACWTIVAITVVMPMAWLAVRSLPLSSYLEIWTTAREEILASLLTASISAVVMASLAFAMAFLKRTGTTGARLFHASLVPFLVSGPLLGIGLIITWNHGGFPALIYDTPAILVIACIARYLCFPFFMTDAFMRQLPVKLDEAAAVHGAHWWPRLRHVLLMPSLPVIVAGLGMGFILSLRELDTAVLLAPPGWNPLSVRLFSLMHYGPTSFVAALSIMTTLFIMLAAAATMLAYAKLKSQTSGNE